MGRHGRGFDAHIASCSRVTSIVQLKPLRDCMAGAEGAEEHE